MCEILTPAFVCHRQGLHQQSMGTTNGYTNSIYPNKLYGHYGSTFRTGFGFGSNAYDSRTYGHGWLSFDNKYKSRGRSSGVFGYGNENIDGMNELNRGPRAKSSKDQKGFVTTVPLAVKGQNIPLNETDVDEKDKSSVVVTPGHEQYNKVEFPESHSDAKFFIIKSYSEDDVHKSIKYNVWASTPNGNRKLDAAYQEALQKSCGCPVFLFFSVSYIVYQYYLVYINSIPYSWSFTFPDLLKKHINLKFVLFVRKLFFKN